MIGLSFTVGNSTGLTDESLFDIDNLQDSNIQSLTQDTNLDIEAFSSFDVQDSYPDAFVSFDVQDSYPGAFSSVDIQGLNPDPYSLLDVQDSYVDFAADCSPSSSTDMLQSRDEKSTCPANDFELPAFPTMDRLTNEIDRVDQSEKNSGLDELEKISRTQLFPSNDPVVKDERMCPYDQPFYLCCICEGKLGWDLCQDCLPSKFFLVFISISNQFLHVFERILNGSSKEEPKHSSRY